MGEEYSFDQGSFNMPRVLVTDGTNVWQEEEAPEHYTTLSETMSESYSTAVDGENGTSQFFSVLETSSETILNDMSEIIDTSRVGENFAVHTEEEENAVVEEGHELNQEIMLFCVEGTDTVYGEQIAQDEEGNFQKYQFQVRQNENGEFETVPETLQVVPFNDEERLCLSEERESEERPQQDEKEIDDGEESSREKQIFIKQEVISEDSVLSSQNEEQDLGATGEIQVMEKVVRESEETALIEMGQQDIKGAQIFMKREYEEEEEVSSTENPLVLKKEAEDINAYQHLYFGENGDLIEPGEEQHEQLEDLKVNPNGLPRQEEENQAMLSHTDLFCYSDKNNQVEEEGAVNNNPSEDYLQANEGGGEGDQSETIEKIHLTGEGDDVHIFIEHDRGMLFNRKMMELGADGPLKETALKNINRIVRNNNKAESVLITEDVEKENMKNYSGKKAHPRSLLKSLVGEQVKEEKQEFDKRFAKGKVAAQARQLQNFISQTKILEVPARTERLPRKQKIKPLVRSGEEIVVQEVVVSSDGFVNTLEDGVLRERIMLETTEYIHLSDSEDETVKRKKKRKQRKSEDPPIVISDSDSEEPIVAPRKLPYQCSKCEKSFPSEGGLNTHMQFHNYSEVKIEEKYACADCKQIFKNGVLLNRHKSVHTENAGKFQCKLCDKSFKDRLVLITHRRTHAKDNMFKKTMPSQISPKKPRRTSTIPTIKKSIGEFKHKCPECNQTFINNILLNRHTTTHKTQEQPSSSKQKPPATNSFKCKDCGKTFSTQILLTSHQKSHKRFPCKNCSQSFASNILLQNHVVKNCVKSPVRKLVTPKKSLLCSPKGVRRFTPLRLQLKCELCASTFPNHTSFLEHKVLVHKEDIPDKSVGMSTRKKQLHSPRPGHTGIPLTKKMNDAFNKLRNQLNKL